MDNEYYIRGIGETKHTRIAQYIVIAMAIVFMSILIVGFVVSIGHCEETLKASYYSYDSLRAEGTWKRGEQMMANGKRFDENAMTCAARLYPLGTMLKVKNLNNGKVVIVKVTDRIGKRFATSRIDLSKGAFSKIAELRSGIVPISVEKI